MTDDVVEHMPFADEAIKNQALGADFLGELVRSRLYDRNKPSMPPAEVFEWYVLDTAYRFVGEEHIFVHALKCDPKEGTALMNVVEELLMLRQLLAKNDQFVLSAKINDILRIRQLKLPQGYDHTYAGSLIG